MRYVPKFEDLRRIVMVEVMQKYGSIPKLALTWAYRMFFKLPPPLLCHIQGSAWAMTWVSWELV